MSNPSELNKYRNLTFEDFGRMASDQTLKPHEKIGFPSIFREGYDAEIFKDIKSKIAWSDRSVILDIGCGCGELTQLLITEAANDSKRLILNDSAEVLAQISDEPILAKVQGRFPKNVLNFENEKPDAIICYSVFHYIFTEGNIFEFIESALQLLKPGGSFLIGDIPNVTKRNRFLLTPAGEAFHKALMKTDEKPEVDVYRMESGRIDDGLIFGLAMRYRQMGLETYILPQPATLPLSNSREDLLFIKPI